ncbi:MAG: T9SS type A sorting domain-containing protein [Rhodothermia bacterium]|nr:T9SS type A sorting domain-containing protein [Rhodothermia bacterium]
MLTGRQAGSPFTLLTSGQNSIAGNLRRRLRRLLLAASALSVGGLTGAGLVPAAAQGTWVEFPDMPSARAEIPHAVLDGQIYVPGGFENRGATSTVEVYDTVTRSWSRIADLPVRMHHLHMVAHQETIFVLGGYEGNSFSASSRVLEYDAAGKRWIERARMPTARGAGAAVQLDGRLYVLGGAAFGSAMSTVESYDPSTDTWQQHAPMSARREHLAAAVIGGKIYAVGGRVQSSLGTANSAVLEAYAPDSDSWTRLAPMPTRRGGLAAAALKGKLYTFGGEIPGTFDETEAYDPATDSWQTMTPMSVARHGIGASAVGDTIYVIAGAPVVGFSTTNVNTGFIPPASTATNPSDTEPEVHSLKIFPNPSSGLLVVETRSGQPVRGRLEVYDILGRRVVDQNVISTKHLRRTLDLSALPAGTYIVTLRTGAAWQSRAFQLSN